jgi:hypothetical protein
MRRKTRFNPLTTKEARHKAHNQNGYVVVKLSHPKRKFSDRKDSFKVRLNDKNLGYVKQKKFRRFSTNPKTVGRSVALFHTALVKE